MRRNARCRAFTMNLSRTGSSDINRGLYVALFSVVHSPMKCGVNGHAFITPRFKCEILSDRLVSVLSTAPARGQALTSCLRSHDRASRATVQYPQHRRATTVEI